MSEINQKSAAKSNGRGGARKGAGRKPSSTTKRTREIAEKMLDDGGLSPLEYMLKVMRYDSDHEDPKIQAQREMLRFEAAKAAAPYVHPRLAAIEHTGKDGESLAPPILNVVIGGGTENADAAPEAG